MTGIAVRPWHAACAPWLLGLLANAASLGAQTTPERIGVLAPILGTWITEDVYQPDSQPASVERGVRRCGMALRDRYVECITHARNSGGREREYRFYLSWDPERSRYTFLSFWSNVAGFQFTTFSVDSGGRHWDIRSTTPWVENGVETRTWSTLRWITPDSIVWIGRRNVSTDSPQSWPIVFRETWTRER